MNAAPDCMALYMACRDGLERRAVPEQVARLIGELLLLSFAKGRVEAYVPHLGLLGDAAKIHKANLRKVIGEAVRAKMLLERQELVTSQEGSRIETVFAILPHWQQWQFPDRFTPEEIARADRARAELEPKSLPVQGALFERDQDLDDGFAEVSREQAEIAQTGGVISQMTGHRGDDTPSILEGVIQEMTPPRFTQENATSETADSRFPLRFKGSKATALNVKGAEVQPGEEKPASPDEESRNQDPDFLSLVERMNRILGPEQVKKYGGLWRGRAALAERAMRYAVQNFEERNPKLNLVKTSWRWLLDGYLRAADQLKMLEKLRPNDLDLWRQKQAAFLTKQSKTAAKINRPAYPARDTATSR
ncbi:MAG: hypothetical protein JWL59_2639 [Chthoniobacteraceae bacterium]|nr:hypothetical protein [Chthoniobacteraceae bacterium]